MTPRPVTAFAIKAAVHDPRADDFVFTTQKTMYEGKRIEAGDTIYLFASEKDGGNGLFARGVVASAESVAKTVGVARQTPRVSISVKRTALANRPFGRADVRSFTEWRDGRPETEINFKFYRQATDKIVGLTAATATFLDSLF
jgi:hypothetical protein